MQRSFTIVLSADVNRAAALYENLSGMTRHFDSDWFVILTQASIEGLEFGILQRDPAIIPPDIRAAAAGAACNCVIPTIQYWTSVLQPHRLPDTIAPGRACDLRRVFDRIMPALAGATE